MNPILRMLLSPLTALAPVLALPAQTPTDATANVRVTIEKYVEAQALLSKEQKDWAAGKDALQTRMDVIRREIESLQKRIGEADASIAEADKKRAELLADQLLATVVALETRTQALLLRLPEPLRERVKPLTQRLPAAGEATKQSIAERWQNVIGILNEVNKWNGEITVTSELRALPDGSSVEVAVVYAGIGQGWYAASNGKVAGIGTAVATGWQWQPANELAPAVLKAIKVIKNEEPAAFVPLPVRIQ
jgi:hypothetical protein